MRLGEARWLTGGPAAFCLVRDVEQRTIRPVRTVASDLGNLCQPSRSWAGLAPGPHIMGILNVTPDSFSDGRTALESHAIERGLAMVRAGASIVDVGGESTRPGADPVDPVTEQDRVVPVVAALAETGAVVSVDTRNASTMSAALDAGARIVNDVSALRHDPASARLVSDHGCPVILMHMRGTPKTMSGLATYGDVVLDVYRELAASVAAARKQGVAHAQIAVDPGFGFAKTSEQSREMLQRLALFLNLSCPIIAGMSRKSFLGGLSGVASAADRDAPSMAAGLVALNLGARILRVHDVAGTVAAVKTWQALQAPVVPRMGE